LQGGSRRDRDVLIQHLKKPLLLRDFLVFWLAFFPPLGFHFTGVIAELARPAPHLPDHG
jgi:hypothetical protein